MHVSELMSNRVISVSPDESAALAAKLLFRHNIGSIPVCTSDGKIRGIVTDRDIVLRCIALDNDPQTTPVREIMSRSIITVSPGDDLHQAADQMSSAQIRRLPVVDNGRIVGMLSLGDMARTHSYKMEASEALSEISSNVQKK